MTISYFASDLIYLLIQFLEFNFLVQRCINLEVIALDIRVICASANDDAASCIQVSRRADGADSERLLLKN